MRPRWRRRWARWATTAFFVVLLVCPIDACGPGRGIGGRRAARRKLMPLVFKQHVPNISENTLGASGLPEGRIHKGDKRFNELVPNRNLDIVFKNEEGTGADWLMTKRCKEKLNTLAISVMNQWPGVKLRVTEAWDDEGVHATDSLHYEGRAVDITTSDRDRSKYGLLARLAVQAGFDWVYYESRSHIHCSVKSESSQAAKSGGCFHGNSSVRTRYGSKLMSQVEAGDELLTMDSNGRLVYSQVMMFLDRDPDARRVFYVIHTQSGDNLTLTPSHLVFVSESANENQSEKVTFARNIAIGDKVYVVRENEVTLETVVDVTLKIQTGVYAPLTRQGTVIVDNVIASCYAIIDSASLAHWAFFPVRIYYSVSGFVTSLFSSAKTSAAQAKVAPSSGVHWYAKLLYSVAKWILPKHLTYDE